MMIYALKKIKINKYFYDYIALFTIQITAKQLYRMHDDLQWWDINIRIIFQRKKTWILEDRPKCKKKCLLCHLYLQFSVITIVVGNDPFSERVTITAHGKPTNQYISKTEHIQIPIRIELKPDSRLWCLKTKTDLLIDVLLVLTIMMSLFSLDM